MEETDYRVGQVLNALDAHQITDNTLVIFSSDNGPETNYEYFRETYQHASNLHFKGGKRDIYEGGHRVPFLMRWPETIRAGSSIDVPVCQTDMLATIADILGVNLPENTGEDSFSLLSAMKGETYDHTLRGPVIHHSASGHFSIRDGKWKLNLFRGSGGSLEPSFIEPQAGEPPYELYNLDDDVGETQNLFFENPEIVDRLKREITNIVANGRSTPGPPQSFSNNNWEQISWMKR
jgi:arylsulfatase A